MHVQQPNAAPKKVARSRGFLKRWGRDAGGATAVEFALVAMPFFLFAFGILGLGLHFFTNNALEHAVDTAARKIRTGQAQKEGKTLADFKQMVCDAGMAHQLRPAPQIHVQSANCRTSRRALRTTVRSQPRSAPTRIHCRDSPAGPVAVLVTAPGGISPEALFLLMGDLANGSALIRLRACSAPAPQIARVPPAVLPSTINILPVLRAMIEKPCRVAAVFKLARDARASPSSSATAPVMMLMLWNDRDSRAVIDRRFGLATSMVADPIAREDDGSGCQRDLNIVAHVAPYSAANLKIKVVPVSEPQQRRQHLVYADEPASYNGAACRQVPAALTTGPSPWDRA
jgi:Flp pilus assembly protein TadG